MNPVPNRSRFGCWLAVVTFAMAFAWVESAVVYYLRTFVDRIEPYQPNPLPLLGRLGPVELGRELATMIMLFTVGVLAGKGWRERWAYAALAFGVWDIFYYVFLKVMCPWPNSLLDWDLLFLIPLPWWGPVLAPVLIALLMIVWGTLASQFERPRPPSLSNWGVWVLNSMGVTLALYVFMADAIRVAPGGVEALRTSVQAQLQRIAAFDSGDRCEACGRPDHRDTAVAVRALEVMGRVYHLDRAPTRIVDMPDFAILRDALDEALAPYPEAREAVGRALGDAARASRSDERAGAREAASRRRRRSPNATAPAASEGDRGE